MNFNFNLIEKSLINLRKLNLLSHQVKTDAIITQNEITTTISDFSQYETYSILFYPNSILYKIKNINNNIIYTENNISNTTINETIAILSKIEDFIISEFLNSLEIAFHILQYFYNFNLLMQGSYDILVEFAIYVYNNKDVYFNFDIVNDYSSNNIKKTYSKNLIPIFIKLKLNNLNKFYTSNYFRLE